MKACEWIDRLKVKKELPSDYAAAKLLGVSQSSIIKMRSRNSTLDDESTLKVALLLDIDPVIILADQATERSKDAAVQTAWRNILAQLLSKEKAPHMAGMAGLGLGGNGGKRKPKKPAKDKALEAVQLLAKALFPTPGRAV